MTSYLEVTQFTHDLSFEDIEEDPRIRCEWQLTCSLVQLHSTSACGEPHFTGSDTKQFHLLDPTETLTCPCGASLCTPHHLIMECPLFHQSHVNHAIHMAECMLTLWQLFSNKEYTPHLLAFLQASCAASWPLVTGATEVTIWWYHKPPTSDVRSQECLSLGRSVNIVMRVVC